MYGRLVWLAKLCIIIKKTMRMKKSQTQRGETPRAADEGNFANNPAAPFSPDAYKSELGLREKNISALPK
ncbi:hypothetical protein TSAR_007967 [Trichomalopsis sarcophagae]|uniref:Uncharacterized protein n=1 Tax=Trichomalopsis sarcophagae TaxID=543379 RepID=A0A232F4T3_9HYME|nr:hypothetical protein TSAR_007967 [Trichomalopsis sarcophagae]